MDDIYMGMSVPELERFMVTRDYMMLPAPRREYLQNLLYSKKRGAASKSSAEAGFPQPSIGTQMQERAGIKQSQLPAIQPMPSSEDLLSTAFNPSRTTPQPVQTSAEPLVPTPRDDRATRTPVPETPDYLKTARDMLLTGGGGFKPPQIPRADKSILDKIPEAEARKPGETYKADPYMTMLQTGLRILAAKPELGQSGLAAVAGPLAQGVQEYRGEKDKERQSRMEEEKAARDDIYRRATAAREKAGLGLQLSSQDQAAVIAEARLKQEAALAGQSNALQRAGLALRIGESEAERPLKTAQARYYATRDQEEINRMASSLEDDKEKLEARLQDPNITSGQRQIIENKISRVDRELDTIRGTSRETARGGITRESQLRSNLRQYDIQLAKLQSQPKTTETETAIRQLQAARQRLVQEMGEAPLLPSILPPAPRTP